MLEPPAEAPPSKVYPSGLARQLTCFTPHACMQGWYGSRSYHHTGMVSMWYALREALAIVAEEGLDAMWARHEAVHKQMWDGLRSMGLEPFVEDPKDRLVTVNTIKARAGCYGAGRCV